MREITRDLVLKRNPRERLKQEKMPLDILRELPLLIEKGYEAIPEEDMVRLQWYGLYHDKPRVGTFMMRIKIPNGILTPRKLRTIGELSIKFSRSFAELSTRQNIQLHYIRLQDLPETFETLQGAGLTTVGGCGDTVRNITGCPVAGLDKHELFDVRPIVMEVANFLYGNREYSDLPRKHKITIAACPSQCNAPEIHCQAYIGVKKGERLGFAVRVGGGLSTVPRLSRSLGVFVEIPDVLPVIRAILDIWKEDLKYRLSFVKARLKFMVDDHGPERFREMVEARLGRRLEDLPELPRPSGETDHLGIHEEKEEGLFDIGFPVFAGIITGTQMVRIADLVEAYGRDIRLTRSQNLIITGVQKERLDEVLKRMEAIGFSLKGSRLRGTSIACTGQPYCNFAVAETKGTLMEIVTHLEEVFGEEIEGLKIYLDGCPHACGKHWVGDIGLQGTTATLPDGQKVPAYEIILRGGLGPQASIGKAVVRRVPLDQVKYSVERLVRAYKTYVGNRGGPESFRDFCLKHPDEELQRIARGAVEGGGDGESGHLG